MATNNISPKKGKILDIPGAPIIGTATADIVAASVAFTASSVGGPSRSFTVTSSPGSITATGFSSPIRVSGLTAGTAYTFTVTATNPSGNSVSSDASNSATPLPGVAATGGTTSTVGSYKYHRFDSSGTFTVTNAGKIDILVVGAGGGGGGSYNNNYNWGGSGGGGGGVSLLTEYSVTAQNYSIAIGAGGNGGGMNSNGSDGGGSSFASTVLTAGGGGGGKQTSGYNAPGAAGTGTVWSSASGGDNGGGGSSGYQSTFTGTEIYWGGGGGGAQNSTQGGGLSYGGAGNGSAGSGPGGGGGGNRRFAGDNGGAGYKGVVIVRYFA